MAALAVGGIGIEAGIATTAEVDVLSASPFVPSVLRVLVEPGELDPTAAVALAWSIEGALARAGVTAPRLHHGVDAATWAVVATAAARSLSVRIGLEDVLTLPDGTPAAGNAELMAALA